MKTTGYQLCDLLRKTAEETANPERAQIMLWAADEVERLINEVRILEKENARLAGKISEMESISLANVKEHAPPPLESESAATEGLHGGCCVSSCSESSIIEGVEFNELDAVQIRQLSLYKFEVCLFGRGHEAFFRVLNDNLDQILDARMCLKTFPSKWLTSPLVRSRNQKWRQSQGGPPAMPPQDLPESLSLEKLPDTQHP